MAGENESRFNSDTVCHIQIFIAETQNQMTRHMHHHTHGFVVGKVVDFTELPNNIDKQNNDENND